MYKNILVEREEGFAIVTMNRPREMNAQSAAMRAELQDCFTVLENDATASTVVLTGGDYVFSAGLDLKEMTALADGEIDAYFKSIVAYLDKIYTFRKPVIAAVGGIALGGGFNLALVCDMIIASEAAIFGHPELKIGLNPFFSPLWRLVGMAKAKEITMLGEPIGAQEALRLGLVNRLTTPEHLMEEATAMARKLSRCSTTALAAVKRISDIVPRLDKSSALALEYDMGALLFSRAERKAYMEAFLADLKRRKKDETQSG